MCGICGVMDISARPAAEGLISDMADTLLHRGPDSSGVYTSGSTGLGHRRLQIIDLSDSARQPMTNEDRSLWIVFNGEIYNYRSLTEDLKEKGHIFRSASDTETILHLYEEKGPACVKDLDGMFAFGLWDQKRRRIFLARDRVGKKPLYYYWDGKLFAFASEIKALLAHPGIKRELSPQAIPLYLTYGYVPTPGTFYKNIFKLPPASTLLLDHNGKIIISQYWDLSFSQPDKVPSEEESAFRVRELLFKAVGKRLISDVPLGAFLSGGVDSSIVVGMMSRIMKERVKTFSIGFIGDDSYDETRYARLVAEKFHTAHTEFKVRPSAFELVEKLLWHHDEPYGDSSAIPTYIVSKLTKEHVTVALNGDGGDELFAGYLKFFAGVLSGKMPALLDKAALRLLALIPRRDSQFSRLSRARRFFEAAALPPVERQVRWSSFFYGEALSGLLRREWTHLVDPEGILHSFRECLEKGNGWTPLGRLLYLNTKTYLLDDLLVKMDRMTMANALEGRSPFLDTELMEYVAALPDRTKLRGRRTKYILKKACTDILPREIQTRGKQGFGVPLGAWFRTELRDYLHDALLAPSARITEYLRQERIGEIIGDHETMTRDYGQQLWCLLQLELWLRKN